MRKSWLTSGTAVILMAVGPMVRQAAAGIAWDAPRNIYGAADVSTEGYYYGSWSPGNATAHAGTVNGVTISGYDLEISISGFAGSAAAFGTHTSADATYNALLRYGTWSAGPAASFTLNGTGRRAFTPGRQYLVQVWVSDARAGINARNETISGSASLSYKTASGMGQYVIGRFTADAASQSITVTANTGAQVNLVQVRDITPPESMTRFQRWKTLKYGIFSHYTYTITGDVNTAANGFNAQAYANDVAQAGAQYVVWTAWQSTMFPMFPSKVAEKYSYSGRCSQLDSKRVFEPKTFVTTVFVNMLSGPLDMNNGFFDLRHDKTTRVDNPMECPSTVVAKAARTLITFSGATIIPDIPEFYQKCSALLKFITSQQQSRRESKTLSGVIGEHIVMARQSSQGTWLVGAATNEQVSELDVKLDFLPPPEPIRLPSPRTARTPTTGKTAKLCVSKNVRQALRTRSASSSHPAAGLA